VEVDGDGDETERPRVPDDAELDPAGEAEGSGSGEGDTGPSGVTLPPSISARARDRSRDREAGAETEVEADGNGGSGVRSATQRSRTRVHQATAQMHPVIDLTEQGQRRTDEEIHDTDMMDLPAADHSHALRIPFEDIDVDAVDAVRSTSLSPDLSGHGHGGQRFGIPRAGTSGVAAGADTSEGEGSGASGGSAEGIAMDVDLGPLGSSGEGDLTLAGKRKR